MAIGEDGRRLLREACVENGAESALGNKIADWLDKHPHAEVTITGKSDPPKHRVFGRPDPPPVTVGSPFGLGDEESAPEA